MGPRLLPVAVFAHAEASHRPHATNAITSLLVAFVEGAFSTLWHAKKVCILFFLFRYSALSECVINYFKLSQLLCVVATANTQMSVPNWCVCKCALLLSLCLKVGQVLPVPFVSLQWPDRGAPAPPSPSRPVGCSALQPSRDVVPFFSTPGLVIVPKLALTFYPFYLPGSV